MAETNGFPALRERVAKLEEWKEMADNRLEHISVIREDVATTKRLVSIGVWVIGAIFIGVTIAVSTGMLRHFADGL